MMTPFHSTRIAIIGAGNVGATCAYTLLLRWLAEEIVLVDANQDKAKGEAIDLDHAISYSFGDARRASVGKKDVIIPL